MNIPRYSTHFKHTITKLKCHFSLDFADIEGRWGIDFGAYFAADLARIRPMEADGLLRMNERGIRVLPRGRLLIRNICMAFDAYRNGPGVQVGFSKVI